MRRWWIYLGILLLGAGGLAAGTGTFGVVEARAFGARPNDGAPDGAALQAALDSLRARALRALPAHTKVEAGTRFALFTLHLEPGLYLLEQPLFVDLSFVRLEGRGAVLRPTRDFSPDPCAPPALLVAYASLRWRHQHGENLRGRERGWIHDLTLLRPSSAGPSAPTVGLWIGPPPKPCPRIPAGSRNAFFLFSGITLSGFPVGIRFGNHTWRITFDRCKVAGCDTALVAEPRRIAPSGTLEFGENMRILNSLLSSGITVLNTGEFHFVGVSFLNHSLVVGGDATVFVDHSHLENPGGRPPLGRFVRVEGPQGFLVLRDSRVIAGRSPGGPLDRALFFVDSTEGGLVLEGVHVNRSETYRPELRDSNRVLVAGSGPVQARDVHTYNGWGGLWVVAKQLNLLADGGAEKGLRGWSITGSVQVSDQAKNGRAAFLLGRGSLAQQVPVRPGERVGLHLWLRLAPGPAGAGNLEVQLEFLDSRGEVLATRRFTPRAETQWKVWVPPHLRVPAGAAALRLRLQASGPAQLLVDDVILNAL